MADGQEVGVLPRPLDQSLTASSQNSKYSSFSSNQESQVLERIMVHLAETSPESMPQTLFICNSMNISVLIWADYLVLKGCSFAFAFY